MAMASTVDVLVPGLFVLIEPLASRRSGEVPGHANVPQLSPSEGTKMTQPTTLLPGVSLTLLPSAGCAVGPNYKRPSVDVPGMCRGRTPKDVAQPAPESLGDLERWEVFHDKQRQDLIHTGLQQNYDVRVAATRILEAQAHVGITRTDQLPLRCSLSLSRISSWTARG
jgi:hypothetical protein